MQEEIVLDIKRIFENELVGMTTVNISLEDLLDTRKTLVSSIKESLTNEERKFLISIKKGKPEWDLLGLTGVENLPAVKWKLLNIDGLVKSRKIPFSSFRRKPESSHFNSFWTPTFAGVTEMGLFTTPSILKEWKKRNIKRHLKN
jgi:hypothetical protein